MVNKAKEPFIGSVQANSSPPQVAPSYACLFSSVIHPLVHALSHQPSSSFLTSLHILLNFHTDLKKDIKPPSKYNPIPAASHPSNCNYYCFITALKSLVWFVHNVSSKRIHSEGCKFGGVVVGSTLLC